MTEAGVKAYRRLNPGSKLKTAVTGKVKPGSKAAKRRIQKQQKILTVVYDKQEKGGSVNGNISYDFLECCFNFNNCSSVLDISCISI